MLSPPQLRREISILCPTCQICPWKENQVIFSVVTNTFKSCLLNISYESISRYFEIWLRTTFFATRNLCPFPAESHKGSQHPHGTMRAGWANPRSVPFTSCFVNDNHCLTQTLHCSHSGMFHLKKKKSTSRRREAKTGKWQQNVNGIN